MCRRDELAGIPTQLWRMVLLAPRHLLMLDYDGTLAPFHAERGLARPSPQTLGALRRIMESKRTQVAVVSGRPLSELEPLLDGLKLRFVGEHGWESRASDGIVVRRRLEPEVAAALDGAERAARIAGMGQWIERKRAAIVLHTRGRSPDMAQVLEQRLLNEWKGYASDRRLVLESIDGGIELRAFGRNKGTAVLTLLSQAQPGTLGAFVGDDVSDEDAFDAVRDWGFGVRIGASDGPTLAQGWLPSQSAVTAFLEEWADILGEDRAEVGS